MVFLNEIWLCVNDKSSVNEMCVKRQLILLTIHMYFQIFIGIFIIIVLINWCANGM